MTSEGRGENYTSETEMNDGGEKEMETIKPVHKARICGSPDFSARIFPRPLD